MTLHSPTRPSRYSNAIPSVITKAATASHFAMPNTRRVPTRSNTTITSGQIR